MVLAPKNLRADARRNYDLLVATATNMLALPDPNFSFNELAKHAGVGIATLYRHFPTKQTLLEVIYSDKVSTLGDALFATLPADQALEAWLQRLVTLSRDSPGFQMLIDEALEEADSPLYMAGSNLLKSAQKASLLRNDVGIVELLGLIKSVIDAPQATHASKMLSVVLAGLRK
jgi:AcrR family transcriptional regulator